MLVEPVNNKRRYLDIQYNGKYWITICGIGDWNEEDKLLNKKKSKQKLVPQDYEGLSGTQHPHENVPLKRTEYSSEDHEQMNSQTGLIQVWSYG